MEFLVVVSQVENQNEIEWTKKLKYPVSLLRKNNIFKKYRNDLDPIIFIIKNYEKLPENIIFVHKFEKNYYHNGSLIDIINNIEENYKNSKTKGFYNFGSQKMINLSDHKKKMMIESGFWNSIMKPYFKNIEDYGNWTHERKGTSQFVVSRNNILKYPIEFYERIYNWFLKIEIDEPLQEINYETMEENSTDKFIRNYLEWCYEMIFTYWNKEEVNKNLKKILDTKEKRIFCLYGALEYYIDVTEIFEKHFIKDGNIKLDNKIVMNEIFSDPIYLIPKTIRLYFNDKIIIIDENYNVRYEK